MKPSSRPQTAGLWPPERNGIRIPDIALPEGTDSCFVAELLVQRSCEHVVVLEHLHVQHQRLVENRLLLLHRLDELHERGVRFQRGGGIEGRECQRRVNGADGGEGREQAVERQGVAGKSRLRMSLLPR